MKPVRPDNNLGKAIVAMILFWPLGVPALVKATKVNTFYNDGNYAAAEDAAKSASKWGVIGIIVGIILRMIPLLLAIIYYTVLIGLGLGLTVLEDLQF